jgi:hypothetical protein
MLLDSFRMEYKTTNSPLLREKVTTKYNSKIFNFLKSTDLDSLKVHVDTIIADSLTVTTEFHCNKDIALKYGMTFIREMTGDEHALFDFMRGLRIGSDTTLNFAYMGSHELRDPNDSSFATLRIFAFPYLKAANK